jgi:capsular polysaccharide transport system permease protein
MIDRIKQTLLRRRIIGAAVIASLLAAVYWLAIASDRYVSEAHVIIQRTDLPGGQGMDFSSLLGGAGGNRGDQLLLRLNGSTSITCPGSVSNSTTTPVC